MTIKIIKPLEVQEVKKLLNDNDLICFELTKGEFCRKYIINLQKLFSNHVIFEIKWLNKLIIEPSISTKVVLTHINEFYNCIQLFDKTAHFLMNLMADVFSINLKNSRELYDLKRNRSEKQRGEINSEWEYHFHGKGCSFTNVKTGQFLDVQIINGLEFGEINTYYLMKFIQTTKSLKKMSLILNNKISNMRKVIEVLWMRDYLVEIPGGINRELAINRKKNEK